MHKISEQWNRNVRIHPNCALMQYGALLVVSLVIMTWYFSVRRLLLLLLDGRRHAAHDVDGGAQRGGEGGGHPGALRESVGGHAELAERVAGVRVPARRVPPRHEVVVHERTHQAAVTEQRHDEYDREQHDLGERRGPEDVPRLELDQGDEQTSHPQRILTKSIKDSQGIRSSV